MEVSNNNTLKSNDKSVFPVCFLTGLLGFFIMWQADVDYSGIKGFFTGFLAPFVVYIFAALLQRKKEAVVKQTIHIEDDEVKIKETNSGKNVEINISISKSILYLHR